MKKLPSLPAKPANAILALVGVLYPFIVYFGGEHVSAPMLGLVLGALWLVRAPALLHQPGGRWMLAVTLAYCAVLAFAGSDTLLRWYPSLVCALLFCTFAYSLTYGPPMIERVARLIEPDLPPVAVAYTRKVTWAWVIFFAANGTTSALLALWGPLSWWTFYNGFLAYAAMGTLFAVEWLLRQRMRRRINRAPMHGPAQRLASHPWVRAAAGGYAGTQGPGMVVALSASGRSALLRHGRVGLVNELGQHGAGDDALSTPLAWRFVDSLPDAAGIDTLLQAPLPDAPLLHGERMDGDTLVLSLELPLDMAIFADHFPDAPVLPGVVQMGWALAFAAEKLGTPRTCRGVDQLKFQRLLRPGDAVELTLLYDATRGRLHFAYRTADTIYSSAHLRLHHEVPHAK